MGMQTNILNDACACTTFNLLSRSPICSSSSSSLPSPSASVEAPAAASASQELFGSRLGSFQVSKKNSKPNGIGRKIELETPNLITSTSRGVVPHLTLDHVMATDAIKWVHVPFETFLENNHPIIGLFDGPNPLERLLGLEYTESIVSMSLRDPLDNREMPPNGNKFINASCIRGVRQVTPDQYKFYVDTCQPDIIYALSDIPYTPAPFSQKRITKSLERSVSWLTSLLRSGSNSPAAATTSTTVTNTTPTTTPTTTTTSSSDNNPSRNILVQMVGDTNEAARRAFSNSLIEKLYGKEAEQIAPYRCLDEGILGYTFDLLPLRTSLLSSSNFSSTAEKEKEEVQKEKEEEKEKGKGNNDNRTRTNKVSDSIDKVSDKDKDQQQQNKRRPEEEEEQIPNRRYIDFKPLTDPKTDEVIPRITELMKSSLGSLTPEKVRVVTGVVSPHEVLVLVRDVGVDLFDVAWAQKAADWGVALDFTFPAPTGVKGEKRDLGHNIYSSRYTMDFGRLADSFWDGASSSAFASDETGASCISSSVLLASSSSPSSSSPSIGGGGGGTTTASGLLRGKSEVCPCIACSPRPLESGSELVHASADIVATNTNTGTGSPPPPLLNKEQAQYDPPYTRAYIHHLLHTHEMSAHAFLAAHNLSVANAFFSSIRSFLKEEVSGSGSGEGEGSDGLSGRERFGEEVKRFCEVYDGEMRVFKEAKRDWIAVDYARGKGRLAREKAGQGEEDLKTKVEVEMEVGAEVEGSG